MNLLNMLATLNPIEWAFWGVTIYFSVKGYMEYPNILNPEKKYSTVYKNKPSFQ